MFFIVCYCLLMFLYKMLADCFAFRYICASPQKRRIRTMFGAFDFQEFVSAFVVLFAVIDIIGSIPIILNLKERGGE